MLTESGSARLIILVLDFVDIVVVVWMIRGNSGGENKLTWVWVWIRVSMDPYLFKHVYQDDP